MTEQELRNKWPQAEFEQWKAEGSFGAATTYAYEEYLQFRREQQEESEQQIRELTERYGEPPGEQPPELSEEDHRILSEIWAEAGRRNEQSKLAA